MRPTESLLGCTWDGPAVQQRDAGDGRVPVGLVQEEVGLHVNSRERCKPAEVLPLLRPGSAAAAWQPADEALPLLGRRQQQEP